MRKRGLSATSMHYRTKGERCVSKNNVRIDLNEPQILAKVQNDKIGLMIAKEWWRLITPWTPARSGLLRGTIGTSVNLAPFQIKYDAGNEDDPKKYPSYVYFSEDFNFFKELSPFATDHWDEKAAKAGQLDKLYTAINSKLKR